MFSSFTSKEGTSARPTDHAFIRPRSSDSRSPCPALNTLANHGYVRRDGENLTFLALIQAIVDVYNISYPLAFLLTLVGFLTCGKFKRCTRPTCINDTVLSSNSITCPVTAFRRLLQFCLAPIHVCWTLSLQDLCQRGPRKITHDAAFVHPNSVPSDRPNKCLVSDLLKRALEARDAEGQAKDGLSLVDLAHLHADRESALDHPLSAFHEKVALGECALAWSVLRARENRRKTGTGDPLDMDSDVVPVKRLETWFGEERLPEGWWDEDGVRPSKQIGLFAVKGRAHDVQKIMEIHCPV